MRARTYYSLSIFLIMTIFKMVFLILVSLMTTVKLIRTVTIVKDFWCILGSWLDSDWHIYICPLRLVAKFCVPIDSFSVLFFVLGLKSMRAVRAFISTIYRVYFSNYFVRTPYKSPCWNISAIPASENTRKESSTPLMIIWILVLKLSNNFYFTWLILGPLYC